MRVEFTIRDLEALKAGQIANAPGMYFDTVAHRWKHEPYTEDDAPARVLGRWNERGEADARARNDVADAYAGGTMEFRHASHDGHGLVIPDASSPGKWRISRYDRHGFGGHSTYSTRHEALAQLADDGYTVPAAGSLDRLAAHPDWAEGERRAKVMQTVNELGFRGHSHAAREVMDYFHRAGATEAAHDTIHRADNLAALRRGEVPHEIGETGKAAAWAHARLWPAQDGRGRHDGSVGRAGRPRGAEGHHGAKAVDPGDTRTVGLFGASDPSHGGALHKERRTDATGRTQTRWIASAPAPAPAPTTPKPGRDPADLHTVDLEDMIAWSAGYSSRHGVHQPWGPEVQIGDQLGLFGAVAERGFEAGQYFPSGSNHQGEIRGFADAGWNVGVAADQLTEPAIRELQALAGRDTMVFVDSGAFSEVAFDDDGEARIVRPIPGAEWERRLDIYARLAWHLGSQAYLVAPDMVGHQAETLGRLAQYAHDIRALRHVGANILVPLQGGAMSLEDFDAAAADVIGFNDYVRAIPMKKGATSLAALEAYVKAARPKRVHLLGLGIDSPRAPAVAAMFARVAPDTEVTLDSVKIRAAVGRGSGKARPLTAAGDDVRRHLEHVAHSDDSPDETPLWSEARAYPSEYTTRAERAEIAAELGLDEDQGHRFISDPDAFLSETVQPGMDPRRLSMHELMASDGPLWWDDDPRMEAALRRTWTRWFTGRGTTPYRKAEAIRRLWGLGAPGQQDAAKATQLDLFGPSDPSHGGALHRERRTDAKGRTQTRWIASAAPEAAPVPDPPAHVGAVAYYSPRERPLTEDEAERRRVAYAIKDADAGDDFDTAAAAMAPHVPPGAVLVPIPSSLGDTSANLELAHRVAALVPGAEVRAILDRTAPQTSSHQRRREGLPGHPSEAHRFELRERIEAGAGPVVFIDNVVTSGATFDAARRAVGHGQGVAYAAAGEYRDGLATKHYERFGHAGAPGPGQRGYREASPERLAAEVRARGIFAAADAIIHDALGQHVYTQMRRAWGEVDADDDDGLGFLAPEDLPALIGWPEASPHDAADVLEIVMRSTDPMGAGPPRAIVEAIIADQFAPAGPMRLVNVSLDEAADFIAKHHSTMPQANPRGLMYAIGIKVGGRLVAVATAGTPTGRWANPDAILELTRIASDGTTKGASSKLAARLLDLAPQSVRAPAGSPWMFVTYSLADEAGTTYRALRDKGLRPVAYIPGKGGGGGGARGGNKLGYAAAPKVRWEAGPMAGPARWDLINQGGKGRAHGG